MFQIFASKVIHRSYTPEASADIRSAALSSLHTFMIGIPSGLLLRALVTNLGKPLSQMFLAHVDSGAINVGLMIPTALGEILSSTGLLLIGWRIVYSLLKNPF